MSKIKISWLWIVVVLEVVGIAGILVWALFVRQPEAQKSPTTTTVQKPSPTYNTHKVELVQFASGLNSPVTIAATPNTADKRLFIVEQTGLIRIVNADGTLQSTPFLDIKNKIKSGGELGLLGLAFDPKIATNNYFYVNYTDKSTSTVISRFTISKSTGAADPSSEKVLLKIKQPYDNHNGGNLAFGPDGYLYIGMGDGGNGGDPEDRAQNTNELLGKMLRIDVGSDAYTIPDSNPFAKEGGKPEIWALGLRNPWRFSFDSKTGDLYIADVGQGNYEEINFQPAQSKGGVNYGWRCYEGAQTFKLDGCQPKEAYTMPILQYDHGDGRCSVTGGSVYHGAKFPALAGKYFYADFCSGQIFYANKTDAGVWLSTLALASTATISTFGTDSSGELYLADYAAGTIYKLTDTAN